MQALGKRKISKRSAPCIRNDSCSKKFPNPFSNSTTNTKDDYQLYRRKKSLNILEVVVTKLDNRCVISYNPYLLLKFNSHIKVEICTKV